MTRNLTMDSIVSFTPDHGWTAHFQSPDLTETWMFPVIGWAVYVRLVDDSTAEQETDLTAVLLLEDEYPVLLTDYLRNHISDGHKHQVTLRRDQS